MASFSPDDFPYLFILVVNTDGPQLKEFFDSAAVNYDLDDEEVYARVVAIFEKGTEILKEAISELQELVEKKRANRK